MAEKKLLSIPEYARYRGLAWQTIQRATERGTCPFVLVKGRKFINPEIANKEYGGILPDEEADSKERRDNPSKLAAPKKVGTAMISESKAKKEGYLAELARIQVEERLGKLVSAAEVKEEAFNIARTVRDAILSIPDRLSAELCSITDNNEMHSRLTKELNQALENLSGRLVER